MKIFILIFTLIFTLNAKSLFSNSDQADNSVYIGSLKDLVIATQKTRGLTNSYLNGNTTAMLLVYSNRKDMKRAIGIMESLPLASDTIINTRSSAISSSLVKLNNKAFKRDAPDVFSDYTEEIAQILMLAQTISKRSAKDLNPFGQEASVIMMETMLPMTEYVGQLRGFGSGLAAKGKVSKTELEKIFVLVNEVKTLNMQLQSQMQLLVATYNDKIKANITPEVVAINANATAYTTFAQSKFAQKKINIDPNSYFDDGTKLISSIVKAYNTLNEAILEDSKGWI